jgi:hypothetical protein
MIFVDRSRIEEPDVLRSERALSEKTRLVGLLSSATTDHLSQLRVTFEPSIWTQVKPHLLDLFSSKCAYCERRLTGLDGDIEHYRPKQNAGYGRAEWASLSEHGAERSNQQHLYYSWLAYDWNNLLLICMSCNRHLGKGPPFPVVGARASFLAEIAECRSTEHPLLLDPCFDQAADHLRCDETGLLVTLTERGQFTVEILGLNVRKELVDGRRRAWEEVIQASADVLQSSTQFGDRGETQMLYRALHSDLPYQLARRSAFATRAHDLEARGIFIVGVSEWLRDGSVESLAYVSTAAKSSLVHTKMGKYRGKKMLPERPRETIRRIGIRNYKAIEEIDIEVPEAPRSADRIPGALALLGENATGKSSILEAVALAVLGTEQIERLKVDGLGCLRRSRSQRTETEIRHPAEIVLTLDEGDDLRLSIDLEGRFFGDRRRAAVLLGYGPRRFFSQRRDVRRFQEPWHRVKSMFDPLARLPDPAPWLLSCSKREFDLVVRALRTMMLLPDEALVRRGAFTDSGTPTVFFELDGRHESLETLSEGYKTVIAMGVDVMRELLGYWPDLENAHGIVLIDELDTHLHPRWKMRIAQRLRQALPGVQFLTSTHDPLCLRGYFNKEVQVLRRTSEGAVERVPELPNVQGLSVQQLLTSEYFGLSSTEDPALDESIARYATLLSKPERTPLEEFELERKRAEVGEILVLGAGPAERVVQDAIGEYLLRRQNISSAHATQLRRDAVTKVVEFWNSIEPQARENPDEGAPEGPYDPR